MRCAPLPLACTLWARRMWSSQEGIWSGRSTCSASLRPGDWKQEIFKAERLRSNSTHGTGCAFATALACHLAHGRGLPEAVLLAKVYVSAAIANAHPLGHGVGPLHHLYRMSQPAAGEQRGLGSRAGAIALRFRLVLVILEPGVVRQAGAYFFSRQPATKAATAASSHSIRHSWIACQSRQCGR